MHDLLGSYLKQFSAHKMNLGKVVKLRNRVGTEIAVDCANLLGLHELFV